MVDRILVRAAGSLSIVGAMLFFWVVQVPLIAGFLLLVGLVLWAFTINWKARHEVVLSSPPEGFRPTGEHYSNPGAEHSVDVWHRGIRRVYVAHPTSNEAPETTSPIE